MRYLCVVSYDGTSYAGWQIQPDALSIQEVIENKISMILNKQTKIYGSGRTDAKVHALGQTFHFDSDEIKDLDRFKYSLNQVLPDDIVIKSIENVNDDFNARISAVDKTYLYVLNMGEYNPFKRNYETQLCRKLDVEMIKKASELFKGKHNFQNFTSKEDDEDNFVRTIYGIEVVQDEDKLSLTFNGDGFMKYMIRFIVGMLIQVGLGKVSLQEIEDTLNQKERNVISYKAEPQGLYLLRVNYSKK